MFAFLRRLFASTLHTLGWLAESVWDGLRGKSSAAERAERIAAAAEQERQDDEVAARRAHEVRMEALATDAVVATVELTQQLKAARAEPEGPSAEVLAERRARQARFAAEHAALGEVRSSRVVVEYDEDDGLTWRPA